jgi:hypothetical protein
MFKLKVKPKINIKKLLTEKEVEFKSLDAEVKYETELSDDVTFKAGIKADLNYQKSDIGLSSIKSAEFSFTKKF